MLFRSTHRYVYGYDVSGYRNLEVDHYRIDGRKQVSRETFVFTKQGKPLKKLWYDESGLRTTTTYEYNSKGDLIRRVEYEGDNSVREERTLDYYLYDVNGRWSKAIETTVRNPKRRPHDETRRVLYRTISYRKGPEVAMRRDRKSTRLNSSHIQKSRMPSSA